MITGNKKFGVREGAPFKKEDVQEIGEFIDSIPVKSSTNILREIKKNKKHVIYKYIEWDDKKAGEQFRLQQVRNIVSHVTIEIIGVENSDVPIRAFYSITSNDDTDSKYVDVNTAFTDEYMRLQIISRAKTELKNWKERYAIYSELKPIIERIVDFLKESGEKNE